MAATPADLRKWVRQRRQAETRELAEMRDRAPDPAAALARGLSLMAYAETFAGGESEPLSSEDLRAYQCWARLRNALRVA